MKRLQIELLTTLIKYDVKFNDDFSQSFLVGSFKNDLATYKWIKYTLNQLNYWIDKGNSSFIDLVNNILKILN